MFDSRIFSLCVLSDGDYIDVVVEGFVTSKRTTRANVRVKIELSSKSHLGRDSLSDRKVERTMTLSDGCLQWTLEADLVLMHELNAPAGYSEDAIASFDGSHIHRVPLHGHLGGLEDLKGEYIGASIRTGSAKSSQRSNNVPVCGN